MTLEVVDMHLKVPHSVESPAPPLATQPVSATADVEEEYVEGDSWATALHLLNQSTQMMGRLAAQQAVEVKQVASARVVDAQVRVTQRVEAANHSIHETTSATKAKLAHVAEDVVVLKEKTFRAVGEHVEPIKAKTVEALLPLKEKAIDTILPMTAKGVELVHGRTVETLEKYPKVQQVCSKTWTFVKPYVPAVAAQWWQAASSVLAPLTTKA